MNINRSEIWSVNLDPTIGAEIRKIRPVVVVSSDAVGVLPIKLVAPLTSGKITSRRMSGMSKFCPIA